MQQHYEPRECELQNTITEIIITENSWNQLIQIRDTVSLLQCGTDVIIFVIIILLELLYFQKFHCL